MSFRITGLDPSPFLPLFGLDENRLRERHIHRQVADADDAFPCRISLCDAKKGETLLLLNFEHLPEASPYRSRHAIYVNECATRRGEFIDEVPGQLSRRLLSVRAFDAAHLMVDAEVLEGTGLAAQIEQFFANPAVAYLHVHNARRGCYAARVERQP